MTDRLVIASVQANPTVGAIANNEAIALARIAEAKAAGRTLRCFPSCSCLGTRPKTWR
jgi:NAD+ synthase